MAFRGRFLVGGFSRSGPIMLVSPDGIQWQAISISDNQAERIVMGLVAGSDAVVALLEGPDAGTVSIRRSTDGMAWTATDDMPLRQIAGVRAIDLVWFDGEYVALGSRPSGGDDPTVETIVARSKDGVSWTVERSPGLTLDVARAPIDITTSGERLVILAVTATGSEATILTRAERARGWIVDRPPELTEVSARAIMGTPSGTLIGGCTTAADETSNATIWMIQDGDQEWSSSILDGSDACVWAFARLDDVLLAVGDDGDTAAVWSSTDGSTWSREQPIEVFSGQVGAVAVAAASIGDIWLVAGTDLGSTFGSSPELVAVWRRSID